MSGIAGVFYRDGRPVELATLEAMTDTLRHRGPDGLRIWTARSVGLGHLLLQTTPESLYERQPLARGDLVITADARIDNRDELFRLLALDKTNQEQIPDSELILAAYERWGGDCAEKLLGDFAFAIWDNRVQKLFCFRDHSGIKPFYYYASDTMFAFASEIKALLKLPGISPRVDDAKIAGYLLDLYMLKVDNISTFFRDISRLPPAHLIEVDNTSTILRRYWSLDPMREIRLASDREYAEAFREIFTAAVSCRLRSAYPVGSHLSGGLDSSSVVSVARSQLPGDIALHTFFSVPGVPECDESAYVHAVVAQGGLSHHTIPWPGVFDGLNEIFRYQDEPLWIHSSSVYWKLCQEAQQYGIRVMLDGDDGDSIVSHGFGYFFELAYQGQWDAFASEVSQMAARRKFAPRIYLFHAYPYLTDLLRRGHWIAVLAAINKLGASFSVSRSNLLRIALKPLLPDSLLQIWRVFRGYPQPRRLVAPRLVRQLKLAGLPADPLMRTEREDHAFQLARGMHQSIVEEVGRLAAPFSIEERHPFRDKRLIEFCLALPPQQKIHQGWNRVVMRRALGGLLPSEVQWRGDKIDGLANDANALLNKDRSLLDATLGSSLADVQQYVNLDYIDEVYSQFRDAESYKDLCLPGKGQIVNLIEKAMTFILWKRSHAHLFS